MRVFVYMKLGKPTRWQECLLGEAPCFNPADKVTGVRWPSAAIMGFVPTRDLLVWSGYEDR